MVHGKVGALGGWFSEPANKELGTINQSITVINYQQNDVFLAKWLYQSFAMITTQALGPGWRIFSHADKVSEILRPALEAVVAQDDQIVPGQVWEVPSPWHAAVYLSVIQHHLAVSGHRALFRGQSNSEWEISPSINRSGIDREIEEQRGKLFCDILSELSLNTLTSFHPYTNSRLDLRVSPYSYWAAAQHYGVRTNLIDFTTDAAIAVFFACSTTPTSDGQTASVYVLPLEHALEKGCEVILPPPFAERLYTQRGVFIRSDQAIQQDDFGITEIRFPASFPFSPFHVVRSDVGVVDVLKESNLMQKAFRLAEGNIGADAKNIQELAATLKTEFCNAYQDLIGMWAKYVDFFEDQLYWLAYRVDDTSEAIALHILDPIVESNKDLILGVIQMHRWAVKLPENISGYTNEKKNHLLKLATLLEESICRRAQQQDSEDGSVG